MNENDEPTLKACIHELIFWWKNEKCAPEVLQPPITAIVKIKPIVQDITLKFADLQAETEDKHKMLELSILEVEHRRIRYLYSDYLRVRLNKIEGNPHYYAAHDTNLFSEETKYAKSLSQLMDSHFISLHMSHVPPPFNKLPDLSSPEYFECVLDKHVVIELVSEEVITVEIRDVVEDSRGKSGDSEAESRNNINEIYNSYNYNNYDRDRETDDAFILPNRVLTFEPGHRYLVRYKYIRSLLMAKMIRLV